MAAVYRFRSSLLHWLHSERLTGMVSVLARPIALWLAYTATHLSSWTARMGRSFSFPRPLHGQNKGCGNIFTRRRRLVVTVYSTRLPRFSKSLTSSWAAALQERSLTAAASLWYPLRRKREAWPRMFLWTNRNKMSKQMPKATVD